MAENLLIKHVDDQRLKYSYSVTKKGNNCGLLYNNGIIDCNEIAQKFIINNIEIWLPNSNYGQNKKSTNYAIIDNYLNDLNDNKEINIEQDIQIISKAQNKNTLNKDSCENCKSYRRGDCGGNSKICNDYEMAYTFSNKEVENWPKWGDATYFKHKKKPKG